MKSPAEPVHIVVLNDNEEFLVLFKHLLESDGYQVTATTREEHALRVLSQSSCDLLVQDLERPDGAGGIAVLQLLQSWVHVRQVPCVIASANPGLDLLRPTLQRLGVLDIIMLPLDCRNFLERIRRAVLRTA